MDALLCIKTFVVVAKYRGFTEAARHLDVVPSVVAKRIAQLEKALNTKLFERTTRTVQLSEAGEKLYAKAGALVATFDELLQSVNRDESKLVGHIRVQCPTTLTFIYLGQLFSDFLAENDKITMEIALEDEAVNPAERVFDIGISGRSATYEGVIEIPLCSTKVILCASPDYLHRKGVPASPTDLADHDCLAFKASGPTWKFQSSRGAIHIDVVPRILANDNMTLLRATVGGLGLAILPFYVVRNALAKGVVVPVMTDFPPHETWFTVYVPRRKRNIARITALIDWLTVRMQAEQWLNEITFASWHPQTLPDTLLEAKDP